VTPGAVCLPESAPGDTRQLASACQRPDRKEPHSKAAALCMPKAHAHRGSSDSLASAWLSGLHCELAGNAAKEAPLYIVTMSQYGQLR